MSSLSATGVRKRNLDTDRLQMLQNSDEQGFIQRMKPFNAESAARGLVDGGQSEGQQANDSEDIFTTLGKGINGAIGYVQNVIEVSASDTIDFFRDNVLEPFASYFKLENSGVGAIIDILNGGDFPGQILKLQGDDTDTVTINNGADPGNTTSNIILPAGSGASMTLGLDQLTEFIFDPLKTINGFVGAWRMTSEDTLAGGGLSLTTKGDLHTFTTVDFALPIGANTFVLTADSAEASGMKWAAAGGGVQTPWASTIDAADFSLTNLDILDFNENTDALTAGNAQMYWQAATGLHLNVPTGDAVIIDVNGIGNPQAKFNVTGLDMTSNDVFSVGILSFVSTNNSISEFTGLQYDVAAGETHRWRIDNLAEMTFTAAQLDVTNANVVNVKDIQFQNGGSLTAGTAMINANADGDMISNVATGDTHNWFIQANNKMDLLDFGTDDITLRINNDANAGSSNLTFSNQDPSPAVNQIVGSLRWRAEDDAGTDREYAHIFVHIEDPAAASIDSSLKINIAEGQLGDTLTSWITMNDGNDGVTKFKKNLFMDTLTNIELVGNKIYMDENDVETIIQGSDTAFGFVIAGTEHFGISAAGVQVSGATTTFTISELFFMNATTVTGAADGVMWHDSGTGDILCRTGGAEKNLSDIGTGGGGLPHTDGDGATIIVENTTTAAKNFAFDLTNKSAGTTTFELFGSTNTVTYPNVSAATLAVANFNNSFTALQTFGLGASFTTTAFFDAAVGIDMEGNSIVDISEIDWLNSGTNEPLTGRHEIKSDSTGIKIGVAADDDFIELWFNGVESFRFEEGILRGSLSGATHEIQWGSANLKFQTLNQTDEFVFQTGTARTNDTVEILDVKTIFKSETDQTGAYTVDILQNHNTPATNRSIAVFSGSAENTSSVDIAYGQMEISTAGNITAGSEDGRVSFELRVGGGLPFGMRMEGNSGAMRIGFFNTTPVVQQSPAANSAAIITALENLGLFV